MSEESSNVQHNLVTIKTEQTTEISCSSCVVGNNKRNSGVSGVSSTSSSPPGTTLDTSGKVNGSLSPGYVEVSGLTDLGTMPSKISVSRRSSAVSNSSGVSDQTDVYSIKSDYAVSSVSVKQEEGGRRNSCVADSGAPSPPKPANRPWEKPYTLPPCKICGAKGTGFHYGVNTCEACKGFFRRSLGRQNELECQKSVRCQLKPGKRSMCPYCRFQKCLQVGMSVDGIKTGRYTAEKRRQDTVEVKQLEAKKVLADLEQNTAGRQTELQQMVDVLVEAGNRNLSHWQICDCELLKLNTKFMGLESKGAPKTKSDSESDGESGGAMGHLSEEDRMTVLNKVLALLEDIVKTGVKFMKFVPGFKQLDMEDQIKLFKASLTDMRFLHGHAYYNEPDGPASMMFNLCNVFGEEMGKNAEIVINRLRNLKLTLEERTVLVCLVAFTTDRCELKQPERITEIHDQLLEALQYLLKKNHPGDRLIFPRLVAVFTELRTLNEISRNCVNSMLEQNINRGVLRVPPIFWEINSPT